jgi:hypothetical protein
MKAARTLARLAEHALEETGRALGGLLERRSRLEAERQRLDLELAAEAAFATSHAEEVAAFAAYARRVALAQKDVARRLDALETEEQDVRAALRTAFAEKERYQRLIALSEEAEAAEAARRDALSADETALLRRAGHGRPGV